MVVRRPADVLRGLGLARPDRGLDRARWYYLAYTAAVSTACLSAICASPHTDDPRHAVGGLLGLLVLLAVRVQEYRRGRLLPVWAEVPQALALALAATAAGPLDAAVGLFYAGCFFRVLYASTRRVLLTTAAALVLLGACSALGEPGWQRMYAAHVFGLTTTTLLMLMLLGTLLQQHEDVQRNERLLQSVFDNLDVAVVIAYDAQVAARTNRAARELNEELGLPEPPLPWHSTVDLYHGDGVTPMTVEETPMVRALAGARVRELPIVVGLPDGARRHLQVNAARLPAQRGDQGTGPGVVLTVADVTTRVEAQAQLAHLALHDPLTGLGNRSLLTERMTQWLAGSAADGPVLAVVLLDLDGFKSINDSLGHARGDEVLVAIAARLRGCVRADDVVARLGGDEFAVLVRDCAAAGGLAARICAEVRRPLALPHSRVALSASVGIAHVTTGSSAGDALAAADLAMYAAKALGPGHVQEFHADMRADLDRRLALEADLRAALELEEFELHYQPYVHLETGRVVGAEALVRWRQPQRGLVPPLEFIPLVEDNGAIVPLGRWVLRTACLAAAGWQPADPAGVFTISVNVSGRQLDEPDFVADVAAVLRETGLPPAALTIEITESVFLGETSSLRDCLVGLKELGVRIAVDDFGTGYSSLSRLQSFPVDVLKIDRSFVTAMDRGKGGAVVSAVLALSDALVLDVVAEGVEDQAQADALLARGCRVAQGFHFHRPAPALPGHGAPGSGRVDGRVDQPPTLRAPNSRTSRSRS